MEAIATAFAGMIKIITDNFWLFMMIVVFICSRQNRLAGYMLLAIKCTFGYNKWVTVVIVFITLCTNYMNPRKYYKDLYEQKYQEILATMRKRKNNVINMDDYEDND